MSFKNVEKFEKTICQFFGSKYAVSTDSCTHAIELCLRAVEPINKIYFPKKTYIGIPMLAKKLNLDWSWCEKPWVDYYYIKNTDIVDAAVLWRKNSYIKGTLMCLSFQYQKHLNIGRGGMILTDNKILYNKLKLMSYDGRKRDVPWRDQNISAMGYHYYMTPESAEIGLSLFKLKSKLLPKKWSSEDYPDLSKMKVFKK